MSATRYNDVKLLNSKGYNCAQTIACTYTDLTSLEHADLYKLTECLGGGMGRMREMCGALTGAFLIISYLSSDGLLEHGKTKTDTYAKIRELHDDFVAKLGSSNCKVLLKGQMPKYGLCDEKLQVACEVLEKKLLEMGIKLS